MNAIHSLHRVNGAGSVSTLVSYNTTDCIFARSVMQKKWSGHVRMQRYLCNRALAEALFLLLIGAGLIVYTILL